MVIIIIWKIFHYDNFEKRRIVNNIDGKWAIKEGKNISCSHKNFCEHFHTENEFF